MSDIKIDSERFYTHIQHIYNVFGDSATKDQSNFKSLDAFVLVRGKYSQDNEEYFQLKTSQFHEYLLNYDFIDSIIFFSPKNIYFLVASKKKMILEAINRPAGISAPEIKIILRSTVEDNTPKIKNIFEDILKETNKSEINLGYLKEEKGLGKTVDEFYKVAEEMNNIHLVDSPLMVDEIFQIKDKNEFNIINIASKYSCYLLNYLNKEFENDVEDEKNISHEKISSEIKKLIEKDSIVKKFLEKNSKLKIEQSNLEVKNIPVIQSGGKYTWDPFKPSDSNKLASDIIICKAFASYKEYNSQVIRTFMIDSDKNQQTQYKILLAAFDKLISLLKEGEKNGTTFSEIYEQVKQFILSKDETLVNSIPECMGYGVGIESSNGYLRITENCKIPVQKGMVIFVYLCFDNLNKKNKNYMIQIGDTVCINDNGEVINFTERCPKALNDIHYEFQNNSQDKDDEESNNRNLYDSNVRVTRHMDKKIDEKFINAEKRNEHQAQLLKEKNEDFAKRFKDGEIFLKEETTVKKKDYLNLKCFDSYKDVPKLQPGKIEINEKYLTIFLPIFKQMVPFHIGLIKNASKSEDNHYSILRINFVSPISGNELGIIENNNPVIIREISYKFRDSGKVQSLITQIKELIKKYKAKEQENKEREDIIEQEKIIIRKEKRIILQELLIKPIITGKNTQGVLEAHTNGLRYISTKGEKVDIIYKNIKHAFLQTCETELTVILHFNLKNPILVGKKKLYDVQFYKDIGSQVEHINSRGVGNDYEEYEMELKERKKIESINNEFIRFANNVEKLSDIKFDVPFRELEFTGVPFRSNVTLFPTQNCIISLGELPFFVITINEIDIIYFERVSQSLKNFDMAFIFKDLSRPIKRITAIPMENLDMLKTWADENDILFGEGLYNMNWPHVINSIKDDPETFIKDGCWNFLADNGSEDEEEEEGEDPDPEYEEEEYESSESDYDDDEEEEIESEGEDEGDSALSEQGKSWDSLRKEAIKSDKEHAKKIKEEEKFKKNKKNNKNKKN